MATSTTSLNDTYEARAQILADGGYIDWDLIPSESKDQIIQRSVELASLPCDLKVILLNKKHIEFQIAHNERISTLKERIIQEIPLRDRKEFKILFSQKILDLSKTLLDYAFKAHEKYTIYLVHFWSD